MVHYARILGFVFSELMVFYGRSRRKKNSPMMRETVYDTSMKTP